jgi:hypothetical protein
VRATVEVAIHFGTVSNDTAVAVLAYGRHRLNGAFEAVKNVALSSRNQIETLVVLVPTHFASGHKLLLYVFGGV